MVVSALSRSCSSACSDLPWCAFNSRKYFWCFSSQPLLGVVLRPPKDKVLLTTAQVNANWKHQEAPKSWRPAHPRELLSPWKVWVRLAVSQTGGCSMRSAFKHDAVIKQPLLILTLLASKQIAGFLLLPENSHSTTSVRAAHVCAHRHMQKKCECPSQQKNQA